LWAALRTHHIEAEREVLIREGVGLAGPYIADLLIRCPGGPVIVICDAKQSIDRENVLYLTDDELSDVDDCVLRIRRTMERVRQAMEHVRRMNAG
jgi:hypothetical protein